MKDLIKEVALEVAYKLNSVKQAGLSFTSRDEVIDEYAVKFATAFLAELSKREEAVAWWHYRINNKWDGFTIDEPPDDAYDEGSLTKLFTFPPIHDIEAIENRVAEACAKVYLETYDLTDIADDVRSGEWRKYK